jgi:hypothetical protein
VASQNRGRHQRHQPRLNASTHDEPPPPFSLQIAALRIGGFNTRSR